MEFCVWRSGMERERIKMKLKHLSRNVQVTTLQGTSPFLMEFLCSSWTSYLKLRGLFIKAWYLFTAGITKQENNLNYCRWAELAGFQPRSLKRWCRATRYVGGHILGPPDCMPICRFKKKKKKKQVERQEIKESRKEQMNNYSVDLWGTNPLRSCFFKYLSSSFIFLKYNLTMPLLWLKITVWWIPQ